YFKLSEPGRIGVQEDGRTKFTPAADGKHRYLILDPAQKDRIIKTYTEIASAKPVTRAPRFRPNQQNQQQLPNQPNQPNQPAAQPQRRRPPQPAAPAAQPAEVKPPAAQE